MHNYDVGTNSSADALDRLAEPAAESVAAPESATEATPEAANDSGPAPRRRGKRKAAEAPEAPEMVSSQPGLADEAMPADGSGPRRGWWQRTFGA